MDRLGSDVQMPLAVDPTIKKRATVESLKPLVQAGYRSTYQQSPNVFNILRTNRLKPLTDADHRIHLLRVHKQQQTQHPSQ